MKKEKVEFGVTSKYFSVYQAFRTEAEKLGVVYIDSFNKFTEEESKRLTCLWFDTSWTGKVLGMSLSNCASPIDLDTDFKGAMEALKKFTSKKKMTLEEIEKALGYRVEIVK